MGYPDFLSQDDNDWEEREPRYAFESAVTFYDWMTCAGFCPDELAESNADDRAGQTGPLP